MSGPGDHLRRVRQFVLHDAWSHEAASLSGLRGWLARAVRVGHLVLKGFREDDLPVHAAALTFSFLMSLVPLLAIASAVLKGLGGGNDMAGRLHDAVADMPESFRAFVDRILEIVEKTNFVALGGIGTVVLFLTVVQVLAGVEDTFNRIWGVQRRRTWWQRFTNYTSITVFVPVLVMAAFALSATARAGMLAGVAELDVLRQGLVRTAPLLTLWLAMFLLYVFMPNTRVQKRPAAVSSLFAALAFAGWQKLYLAFQFGIAQYNAIYGTFASVPVFLVWLSIAWMIILLGAELCFALQNHATFHMERIAGSASVRARMTLALEIMTEAGRAFASGGSFQTESYSERHRVPVRLVNDIVHLLVRGGLLAASAGESDLYLLRRPAEAVTVREIVDLILADGTAPAELGLREIGPGVRDALDGLDRASAGVLEQKTLQDLLRETAAAGEKTS